MDIATRMLLMDGGKFAPSSLFRANEQGVWYDPSDLTTLFQDSAGTTPVTAVEQPVGLMLDKSKGLKLGPELITNVADRDFSSDTGWWNKGGVQDSGVTIFSGLLSFNQSTGSGQLWKVIPGLVSGMKIKVTFSVVSISSGSVTALCGGTWGISRSTPGVYTEYITFGSSYVHFILHAPIGTVATVDNVSIKELPGNHAYQSTSANRPTLSARVNLCVNTEHHVVAFLGTPKGTIPPTIAAATYAGVPTEAITFPAGVSTYQMSRRESGIAGCWNQVNGDRYVASLEVALSRPLVGNERISIYQTGVQGQYVGTDITAATNNPTVLQRYTSYHTADINGGMGTYVFVSGEPLTAPVTVYITKFDVRHTNHGTDLPAYQRVNTSTDYDTTGFPPYLSFNGTSSCMATNSIDFSAGDKMSVWAGVRVLTNTPKGAYLSIGDVANTPGSFECIFPEPVTSSKHGFALRMSGLSFWTSKTLHNIPITEVLSYFADNANTSDSGKNKVIGKVNQTDIQLEWGGWEDSGTGNFANLPLNIGCRNQASLYFLGNIYSLIVRGAQSTDTQITNTEKWVNNKVGKVY